MLILDGSQGEGGGQIVRSALTLSMILGMPVRIENIRAGRKPPGLRPQHLTAIQAAAEICDAQVTGASVNSETITFEPGGPVRAGEYEWTIGTAGAVTLVIQTILLPLALAEGESMLRVHGGTHVPNSPSGHYLRDVYAPILLGMGVDLEIHLEMYGWVPEGGGLISVYLAGNSELVGQNMLHRGPIERVCGTAVGCNLPSHIPQRIANRALNLLEPLDAPLDIRPCRTRSISTGAGLFLSAEYVNGRGGFDVLGRKGVASEVVAEQAVNAMLEFHDHSASVDQHLADQLVIPFALAEGESVFCTPSLTPHLLTNIAVVEAFTDIPIRVNEITNTVTFQGR